ncbi:helix-turn-helix domain-containing protein [Pseudomonas chlororaphis]|uniref:helix-turn-helix domain-containing protein n=1 Tax=Pseudomonas chlororaphis TaxID=587753 RepID=UPI00215A5FB2|nr:helix-turn-helix domain-containing protein [Pseudomonas chlororaphis]
MSNDFASKLISLRSEKDLTQQQLADAIGITPSQISRYESGQAKPRKTVLIKLAKALGVEPEALNDDSEPDDVELMFNVNLRDFGKLRCSLHFTKAQHAKMIEQYQNLDEKGKVDLLSSFLKKATLESNIYGDPSIELVPKDDEITSISASFILHDEAHTSKKTKSG